MPLIGRKVAFAVRDVRFPTPAAVMEQLHGDARLSGLVVGVSDSGLDPDAFVVVRVDGVGSPVVVAVERIVEA
jgi:hypothetical protein